MRAPNGLFRFCIDRKPMTTRFKTFIVVLRQILSNFILYCFVLIVGAMHGASGQLNWLVPAFLYFVLRHFNFKKILK